MTLQELKLEGRQNKIFKQDFYPSPLYLTRMVGLMLTLGFSYMEFFHYLPSSSEILYI
jgi:hypothetical protein